MVDKLRIEWRTFLKESYLTVNKNKVKKAAILVFEIHNSCATLAQGLVPDPHTNKLKFLIFHEQLQGQRTRDNWYMEHTIATSSTRSTRPTPSDDPLPRVFYYKNFSTIYSLKATFFIISVVYRILALMRKNRSLDFTNDTLVFSMNCVI